MRGRHDRTSVKLDLIQTEVAVASQRARELQESKALLQQAMDAGLVRPHTCVGNEVYVRPLLWQNLNADGKRGFAISLARICDAENSGNRITVIDDQTGRKLATYSNGNWEVF